MVKLPRLNRGTSTEVKEFLYGTNGWCINYVCVTDFLPLIPFEHNFEIFDIVQLEKFEFSFSEFRGL